MRPYGVASVCIILAQFKRRKHRDETCEIQGNFFVEYTFGPAVLAPC